MKNENSLGLVKWKVREKCFSFNLDDKRSHIIQREMYSTKKWNSYQNTGTRGNSL